MRPTSSEFSRDVQPIWRPTKADIADVPAPLRADGSKIHKHFPSLSGQPSQAEVGDQATKGPMDELCGFAAGALIACPMTMGPAPMIRTLSMSVRLGIGGLRQGIRDPGPGSGRL